MRHSNEFYQGLTEAIDHGKSFGEMIPIFNKELAKDLKDKKIEMERTGADLPDDSGHGKGRIPPSGQSAPEYLHPFAHVVTKNPAVQKGPEILLCRANYGGGRIRGIDRHGTAGGDKRFLSCPRRTPRFSTGDDRHRRTPRVHQQSGGQGISTDEGQFRPPSATP